MQQFAGWSRPPKNPFQIGAIIFLFLGTFILSLAIYLLLLGLARAGAPHRDGYRAPDRPGPSLLAYALIPLIVSLGLRAGILPNVPEWIASFMEERPIIQSRCPLGSQSASYNEEKLIREFVKECAPKYGVDPLLIHAVMSVESNYDAKAVSTRGAMGLMQLTPRTADYLGVSDPFDPRENIEGGIYYLKILLNRYRKNLRLVLAAYNAGPENVKRYRGVPPFPETRQYVQKVLNRYRKLKNRNRKNIAENPEK